ncbi:magnesium transporter CorA family protein [Paracoccus pacificus]|uniref:Magnesium transporter CorA family protein n=1 Tax=Paracoccus pacificus TaxID=1463598 RepID=A0ABW4R7B5_9RHOB
MLYSYASRDGRITTLENPQDPATSRPVWLDLYQPTTDEVKFVETLLGIDIPTRDEMAEIELSDRLYREDNADFMTITAVANIAEDACKVPVTFIIKGQTLVTVRHANPRSFAIYAARAQKDRTDLYTSGEMVMFGLLEAIIDRTADALERIGDEIDAISREVFRNKSTSATKKTRDLQSLIEQIGRKGDLLTKLRESLVSVARMVAYHSAGEAASHKAGKDVRQRSKLIQRDVTALGDHAVSLSGSINFLLDATLGLINLEQNQIIKIFSVAAVVFLPPTLVASIYGMNFDVMPELKWTLGYPWALGLMVMSAVLPFLYFKRRGWL